MEKLLRFVFWTLLLLGVVVGVARATALRWWRVPTADPFFEASVAPTLRGGDLVILWRLTKPSYADLVACPEPGAPERLVVGRIVAEPGDKVTLNDDRVTVNGKASATERGCTEHRFTVRDPNTGTEVTQECSIENLFGNLHMHGTARGHRVLPRSESHEVGEGRVFLLSDNRLYPWDSRNYGTVERATCRETVLFRLVGREGFADVASRFTLIH
jgi:signal peptidase I